VPNFRVLRGERRSVRGAPALGVAEGTFERERSPDAAPTREEKGGKERDICALFSPPPERGKRNGEEWRKYKSSSRRKRESRLSDGREKKGILAGRSEEGTGKGRVSGSTTATGGRSGVWRRKKKKEKRKKPSREEVSRKKRKALQGFSTTAGWGQQRGEEDHCDSRLPM